MRVLNHGRSTSISGPGRMSWARHGWAFCPSVGWWCLLLTTHAWTWWGQAAVSGEGSTHEFHLVSSQDVTPPLSQPCSVFSLGKWTLKSNMTDDIFHFHTSKLCFVFAEPSLMPWMWARQRPFVLASRCCHQALVPVDCQGQPNLAMFV